MRQWAPNGHRVLLLSMSPVLSHWAPAVQVANMAQAFAEQGHDVTVIAPTDDSTRTGSPSDLFGFEPAFRHVALSRRVHRGQSFFHAIRIARFARRTGTEFIYSRNLRACLLPALRGVPTVVEAHTLNTFTGRVDRLILRRLLRATGLRGLVAISQGLADDLEAFLDVPRDLILVAHDAVRHAAPNPEPESTIGEYLEVGYTGSLYAGRGIEFLLEAIQRAPWARLHLVGGPPEAAKALRDDLAGTDIADRVVIHGLVTPAKARELQAQFSVLVAPFARRVLTDSGIDSSRWMSPMKIFEYMASGRPMVVSDLPVLREVLRPDVDALMVPPEDVDALLRALEQLRADAGLRQRLAGSALERVRSEFTWSRRVRAIVGHFLTPPRRTIALVLASFESGGAERVLLNLAAGFADHGMRVILVVLDARGPLSAELDPRVELVNLRRRRARTAGPRLARTLRRAGPDAVLSSQTHINALIGLIRPWLRRQTHVVFRQPSLAGGLKRRQGLERTVNHLMARADAVVASSSAMVDQLQSRIGDRCHVLEIPNPVRVAALRSVSTAGTACQPREFIRAVMVGRLISEKGHVDVIEALRTSEADQVVLEIIGDGPLRATLEDRVIMSGLNNRVVFHGRIDDRAILARHIACADVLVQAAHIEGMPNAVLEALTLGTSVVATDNLQMLSELSAELGPEALRLVPRAGLGEALARTPRRQGRTPAPSLLPDRFDVDQVVDQFLSLLLPGDA